VYLVPGAIIGAQIGTKLQGRFSPWTMERAMAVLFAVIGLVLLLADLTIAQGQTA
jgi:uncharacterized membrane protein YfcA